MILPQITSILTDLIAFDTTSARSNLALITYIARYLKQWPLDPQILTAEDGQKANLWVQIGPSAPGGIVLSGHTDVVPVAGQPWTQSPFQLTEQDEKFYGRGTADMKGFIAVVLAVVPMMVHAHLRKPFFLAFSFDEEVGCLGVPPMIADLVRRTSPQPAMAIIGEPTQMKLVNQHKGIVAHETRVTGRDGHSSQPQRGANAIIGAASLIEYLRQIAADLAQNGPFIEEFDTPYSSINIGQIDGGTAINVIARECRFIWECRPVPTFDPAIIRQKLDDFAQRIVLPRLREGAPEAAIETRVLHEAPPLLAQPDSAIEALIRQLTGLNEALSVAYATEAGLFQQAGIASIVLGPGDIAQAHQPNEFVTISQLVACKEFLERLIDWATQ